jgi:hypothetical protein
VKGSSARTAPEAPGWTLSPGRAVLWPLALAAALAGLLTTLPPSPLLSRAFLGAAGFLALWAAALWLSARRAGRRLTLEFAIRRPHYVQTIAQIILFSWWGWYVPAIRELAPFVGAQLVFAFAVDALLNWTRRDRYGLGFGPIPITLSINLFLLFKPAWFGWQFALIMLGYLAKEFIRWRKDGRSAHIFNPSSFPLAVFSLILILTGETDATLGLEIATTLFYPPHIYLVLFLVSLPGQFLFGVTTMTMSAVVTAYLFGLGFFHLTGTYYFYDAYIPIAVFLGMHLLFTDPSTAPRSESGRVVFGVLYAFAVIGMAALLSAVGEPTFYDKLLPVPILNLAIQLIDRWVRSGALAHFDPSRLGRSMSAARRRVATVGVWALIFLGISAAGGVGDDHPGQFVRFWEQACADGSARGCEHLDVMREDYCGKGSGWACNQLAIAFVNRKGDRRRAAAALGRGCSLGFPAACENATRLEGGSTALIEAPPLLEDLPYLLRGSKGPIRERDPRALLAMACAQGWPGSCGSRFTTPGAR